MHVISYEEAKLFLKNMKGQTDEIVWARIWDDSKRGMKWIEDLPSISPGRWAVGYNYIYVLTRILNEMKPDRILDLGLGISSTIISHYCSHCLKDTGYHDVVEQDNSWKDFYVRNNSLSSFTNIHVHECIEKKYKGVQYNAYNLFERVVANRKYHLISVDGPFGSDRYSRRDIIDFIPGILEESFVIIFDDTNRQGEKDTINELESVLSANGIVFHKGIYESIKDCTVIASEDNRFFCSL